MNRFVYAGAKSSPKSDTWDSGMAYLVCDKWDEYALYAVALKTIVKVKNFHCLLSSSYNTYYFHVFRLTRVVKMICQ